MLSRRTFLKGTFASLLLTTGLASLFLKLRKDPNSLPNLILLIADDLRSGMMSCAGHPVLQTPHIDQLAKDGVLFKDAFVTTPICPVSRASIFTGNYALKHGVYHFNQALPNNTETFLHTLKSQGYYTAFMGKWGIGSTGFEKFDFHKVNDYRSTKFGVSWMIYRKKRLHLTDIMTRMVQEFLNHLPSDKPFVLVISYNAVHVPFSPPKRFSKMFEDDVLPVYDKGDEDRIPSLVKQSINRQVYQYYKASPQRYEKSIKNYYRLISGIDSSVGTIIEVLRKKKLYENTGIIFTSDNGFMLGDHGLWGKAEMYDASLRIPLIVKPPRSYVKPIISDKLALNIDIPVMLLGMANIRPTSMQGMDMMNAKDSRNGFYTEFQTIRPRLSNCEGYRDKAYKYMRYYKGTLSEELMFNLAKDPDELHPLYPNQHESLFAQYRKLMTDEKKRLSG